MQTNGWGRKNDQRLRVGLGHGFEHFDRLMEHLLWNLLVGREETREPALYASSQRSDDGSSFLVSVGRSLLLLGDIWSSEKHASSALRGKAEAPDNVPVSVCLKPLPGARAPSRGYKKYD